MKKIFWAFLFFVSSVSLASDSWYTLSAGKSPWGYYREQIEQTGGKYTCKVETLKQEATGEFHESYGAIADLDLNPIAMNILRTGLNATESIDGNILQPKVNESARETRTMQIKISGTTMKSFPRAITKGAILECFFALYLKKNWAKLIKDKRLSVPIFAETTSESRGIDFYSKTVDVKLGKRDAAKDCMEVDFSLNGLKFTECVSESSGIQWIRIAPGSITATKVRSAAEAKSFLKTTHKK